MEKPTYTQTEMAERNERGCGFIIVTTIGGKITNYDDATMPRYSEKIDDAWVLVKKIREDPFGVGVRFADEIAKMYDADQDDHNVDVFNVMMNLDAVGITHAAIKAVSKGK